MAIIISLFYASWFNLFISSLTIILTFLPSWFEKKYSIVVPLDFEFAIILFIYASLFLGEVNNFYTHFWWWDVVLHTISALAFALIGFIILFILFKTNKVNSKPVWIAIFSFCFSITIGSLWEIFEFGIDQTMGFNMQKSGLVDTMWDIISNTFGAAFASLAGYAYLKGNEQSYIGRFINLFFKENPDLKP
jgi:hypothetical protein